jgi:uncharacterized protein (DUF2252 family)
MSNELQPHTALSGAQRQERGKSLRRQAPRSSHGEWTPAADRPDPIGLLQAQDEGRLEHLLPIKYGRMVESPFAFLRGSAVVMASDLATTPSSGIEVVLCGDAHLSNFGLFATPERQLVFDINDFDEAFPGPWEWDLKRLATSAVVASRANGFGKRVCRRMAVAAVETYRTAMERFAQMHTLDVWYYHVDAEAVLAVFEAAASKRGKKRVQKQMEKARSRTHQQTLEKLTRVEGEHRRIISDPPLLVPFREMGLERFLGEADLRTLTENAVERSWTQYLDSLPNERRYLLQRFRLVDAALRVGGVGSVGTRCLIVVLEGSGGDDALLLQLKEAGPSVLEQHVDRESTVGNAERVVTGQRLMQADSDIFLGWHTSEFAGHRDFYWRQLKDMKGSANVSDMDEDSFKTYIALCSYCLARAHARTGDDAGIRAYIGKNNSFAQAIADFAVAYADQTERDHQALVEAIESGRIVAETGI